MVATPPALSSAPCRTGSFEVRAHAVVIEMGAVDDEFGRGFSGQDRRDVDRRRIVVLEARAQRGRRAEIERVRPRLQVRLDVVERVRPENRCRGFRGDDRERVVEIQAVRLPRSVEPRRRVELPDHVLPRAVGIRDGHQQDAGGRAVRFCHPDLLEEPRFDRAHVARQR
jgi:hypothetical protein